MAQRRVIERVMTSAPSKSMKSRKRLREPDQANAANRSSTKFARTFP